MPLPANTDISAQTAATAPRPADRAVQVQSQPPLAQIGVSLKTIQTSLKQWQDLLAQDSQHNLSPHLLNQMRTGLNKLAPTLTALKKRLLERRNQLRNLENPAEARRRELAEIEKALATLGEIERQAAELRSELAGRESGAENPQAGGSSGGAPISYCQQAMLFISLQGIFDQVSETDDKEEEANAKKHAETRRKEEQLAKLKREIRQEKQKLASKEAVKETKEVEITLAKARASRLEAEHPYQFDPNLQGSLTVVEAEADKIRTNLGSLESKADAIFIDLARN